MKKIRPQTFIIPENEPFKNDALQRKSLIESLTQIIQNINTPYVMSVSASYGMGKTEFIKMWKQYLNNNQINTIYFDAWKSDYNQDPMIPLIGEINEFLANLKHPKINKKLANLKKMAGHITRKAIPVIVKATAEKTIGQSAVSELMAGLTSDAIKNYTKSKDELEEFKKVLTEIIQLSNEHNPLVFFIDELDRCRPSYALEILERIKHLFSIEGVVFVLSMDRDQICAMIKSQYGNNINAGEYLKKFIDVDFSLPQANIDPFVNMMLERFEIKEQVADKVSFKSAFQLLCKFLEFQKLNKFTLRTIEQLICRIGLILNAESPSTDFVDVLVLLALTREFDRKLYDAFLEKRISAHNLVEQFGELKTFLKSKDGITVIARLIGLVSAKIETEDYNNLRSQLGSQDNQDKARHIWIGMKNDSIIGQITDYINKVEFMGNFNFPDTSYKIVIDKIKNSRNSD